MTAPQAPKTYGDEHKTAQQISQMPPAQQREYFEQYMSPEDRANCLQEIANTGTANQPFFAQIFARISADAKAQQQANQYGQQIVQQATGSDTQYVTGLSPSHADYQGIAHTDLQGYVDSGLDAGQIGTMSTGYHQMSSTFDQISTALNDAVNKSQSEWEGNAADSARGYFSSMQQWSDGNSQNARLASEVTYQQSTAAQTAKNTMPAPIPFSWSDEMKGWAQSNPFNLMDNVNASLQKAQASQDAHDQAAQVMSTYDNSLYGAASKQPVFTQPPKFDSSGGTGTGTISGSVGVHRDADAEDGVGQRVGGIHQGTGLPAAALTAGANRQRELAGTVERDVHDADDGRRWPWRPRRWCGRVFEQDRAWRRVRVGYRLRRIGFRIGRRERLRPRRGGADRRPGRWCGRRRSGRGRGCRGRSRSGGPQRGLGNERDGPWRQG